MQYFASKRNGVRDTAAYRVPHKKGMTSLAHTFKKLSGEGFQAFVVEELFADVDNQGIINTGCQERSRTEILPLCTPKTEREREGERERRREREREGEREREREREREEERTREGRERE